MARISLAVVFAALVACSLAAPRTRRSTHDYGLALSYSMHFYRAQASVPPAPVSWRGVCFPNDGNGLLAGGWHDAGAVFRWVVV
jgi:hypothetical protein